MRTILGIMLAGMITAASGCSQETQPSRDAPRMFFTSDKFQVGMNDGKRDAKASWSEVNHAGLWLWMMDEDYRRGYEEGWREGRAEVHLKQDQSQKPRVKPR